MSDLFDRLGRPNAFTRRVAAFALIPSLLLVLGGPWARVGGSLPLWLGIAVLGNVVATCAMVPIRLTILKRGDRPSRPITTLAAFAAAGLIRGVVVGQVGHAAGLLGTAEVQLRVVSGSLVGLFLLPIIALMVQSVSDHSELVSLLDSEKARLSAVRAESGATLARLNGEVVDRVLGQITIRLQAIASSMQAVGSGQRDGGAAVARLIDDVVKPLVSDMDSRRDAWAAPHPSAAPPPSVSKTALFADATLIKPVDPPVIVGACALAGTTTLFPLAGGVGKFIPAAAVAWSVLFICLSVLKAPMRRASRSLGAPGRAVALTVLLELAGLVTVVAVLMLWAALGRGLDTRTQLSLLAASPLILITVGWGIALTAAWNRRAVEIDSELAATVESLKAQVAQIETEADVERERLSRFVHGPVQDQLIAAWAQLEGVDGSPPDEAHAAAAADLIAGALQMLSERITSGESTGGGPPTVEQLIAEYAHVWAGVVEIKCDVSLRAQAQLTRDPLAAVAVGEVIREGIANAARHSRSRHIAVTVDCEAQGSVQVVVAADMPLGMPNPSSGSSEVEGRRGLGSRVLDQVTKSWRLELDEAQSRLFADIPTVQQERVPA